MPREARTTKPAAWQKGSSRSSDGTAADARIPDAIAACADEVSCTLSQGRPVLLACEPSLEGVLAATGISYLAHARDGEVRLASIAHVQPQLGEVVVRAPSPTQEGAVRFAERVLRGFTGKVVAHCKRRRGGTCPPTCSNACIQRLVLAAASDDDSMPQTMYQYLRLGFATGPRVRTNIADPRVAAFRDLTRYVIGECEHTRQFVRFSHMADGSYVASFSPAANTIPLVADHFAQRMGTERFCLVDPRHGVAAFHEASERACTIVRLDGALARSIASRTDLADDEAYVRAMWQRFYQGTSLPGRDRSQRGYDLRTSWMPQRLWDGLTELRASGETGSSTPRRYAGTAADTALPGT